MDFLLGEALMLELLVLYVSKYSCVCMYESVQ
jgi:hypothetical protein